MLKHITGAVIQAGALVCVLMFAVPANSAETSGADIYKAKCQRCHGADGLGNTPAGKMTNTLPLNAPDIVKKSEATQIAATKNGQGSKMPAYARQLTDDQIKLVIAHIRTLQK